jgi:hypothetical protein
MKQYVWTCDFCDKKEAGNILPRKFYQVECQVKAREKSTTYEILICLDCWDQTIDPSPKGLLRRFLKNIFRS